MHNMTTFLVGHSHIACPKNHLCQTTARPRISGMVLKQSTFYWETADKYSEQIIFEMEANNIFMTKTYDIENSQKFLV